MIRTNPTLLLRSIRTMEIKREGKDDLPLPPRLIPEDPVREPDLLEFGLLGLALGLGSSRVLVGVMDEGELAVGFLRR